MSVSLKDVSIKVRCPSGHVNEIPTSDWYVCEDEIYGKSDMQMGCEVCHRLVLEGVQCSVCECSIDAEIEVWEYPEGVEECRSVSGNTDPDDANLAVSVILD